MTYSDAPLLGFDVTPDGRWVDIPLDSSVDLEEWARTTSQTVLTRRGRIAASLPSGTSRRAAVAPASVADVVAVGLPAFPA